MVFLPTNIPEEPKFNGQNNVAPTADQAVKYLKSLTGRTYDEAKKYVINTPDQIDTDYRRKFEAVLGWSLNK